MRTKFFFVVVAIIAGSAGCQSMKMSMPKMPSFSGWNENRPRLFAKKEKENLAPPPKHFDDPKSEAQIARNEPLEIDTKGTPKMPSKALEPYTGNPKKSPLVAKDGFETPKVGGFDASKTPGSRGPYEFKPGGNDELKRAAENLANNWNGAGQDQKLAITENAVPRNMPQTSVGNTDNSFSPPKSSKTLPDASSGLALQPKSPMDQGSLSSDFEQTQPPASKPNLSSSQPLRPSQLGSDTRPMVLTPNMPKADSGIALDNSQIAGTNAYPRTPQSENRFEDLAPMTPQYNSIANSTMKKIDNQFADEAISQPNQIDYGSAAKSASSSFPSTKSQSFTVQPSGQSSTTGQFTSSAIPPGMANVDTQKSPSEMPTRTAKLPNSLKVNQGYKPGSTGRISTF